MLKSILTGIALTLTLSLFDSAEAQYREEILEARHQGSVYRNYGFKTFTRAGVAFSNRDRFSDIETPYGTIGGSIPVITRGRFRLNLEGELYVERSQTDIFNSDYLFLAEFRRWTFAALFGGRAEYALTSSLSPFISLAAGPAYLDSMAQVLGEGDELLLDAKDHSIQVAYSGRAGASLYLGEGFAIEAAYRYLGLTTNPTTGQHGGEIGLSLEF